ncbi:MAG: TIM barrel protein [Lachnospiraceae bacterium]
MITLLNLNNMSEEMGRFTDKEDVRQFCSSYGCDGIEMLTFDAVTDERIPQELVLGAHLPAYNCWMDLWTENNAALLTEFGNEKTIAEYYGGTTREALLSRFRTSLDYAQKLQVKYVVFHISEVKIEESFTYDFAYTDEQVVDAAADWVNQMLDGRSYTFDFLMENLWWPGLNFRNPAIARRLLAQVHYDKKGIMLDTGHLLNTNLELTTQEEAVAYIHEVLDRHEDILPYIKGIHLHQSLSGAFVKDSRRHPIQFAGEYWERFSQIFSYIFQVDTHKPFTAPGVKELVERIAPDYLTYELISSSRKEHEALLKAQSEVFLK